MDARHRGNQDQDAQAEGAHADIALLEEFKPGFFADRDAPLVSMYLTTQHGWPEAQQNRIRFKNLYADVERALERCYDKREFKGMLDALALIEAQFAQDDAGMLAPLRQGLPCWRTGARCRSTGWTTRWRRSRSWPTATTSSRSSRTSSTGPATT